MRPIFYLVFAIALLSDGSAGASTLTFEFTGTVQSVDSKLTSAFADGDIIKGRFTFDPKAPNTDPGDPMVGIYQSNYSYVVTAGTFSSVGHGFAFNIFNNLVLAPGVLRDQYRVALGASGPDIGGLSYNGFTLDLLNTSSDPMALNSNALPSKPPEISDFRINNDFPISNQLRFYFIDPTNSVTGVDYVIGSLDTLTKDRAVSAIPEPSTWAMLLIGFAAIGFAGYRRSRCARFIYGDQAAKAPTGSLSPPVVVTVYDVDPECAVS